MRTNWERSEGWEGAEETQAYRISLQRSFMRRNGVSEVDQCWRAGVPVTSIKVLPARRQIAAFVINPHFKSKKVGPAAEETSLP